MASREPERPNIVVILSDDQGPWALGCAGNDEIHTPALDRLAAEGARLDNLFCTTPVCSPSRASLLTGELPSQHGVHDAIHHGEHPDDPVEYLVGRTTYVERLAEAGYRCAHIGKWHLGNAGRAQVGFSHWFALAIQGSPYVNPLVTRGGPPTTAVGYSSDLLTTEAIAFLDEMADGDQPFLLNLCYNAPHSPWLDQHPEHLLDLYSDCRFESCPQEDEHPWSNGFRFADGTPCRVSKHVDKAFERPMDTLRGYFAAVTGMDVGIGKILDHLDDQGLRESTLVVFLSDNGFSAGHHGIWGKGNGTWPINMYDTAVKVPGIVSQPGRTNAGVVADALVSIYDIRPTLLEWAGVPDAGAAFRPGRSFGPLLDGSEERPVARPHIVVFDEYGPARMIRTRDWKYVHRYPHGPHELYHLAKDPGERHNVVDDPGCASTVEQLRSDLQSWFSTWVDPDVDGSVLPVRGLGQVGHVGPAGDGGSAFLQTRRVPLPGGPST